MDIFQKKWKKVLVLTDKHKILPTNYTLLWDKITNLIEIIYMEKVNGDKANE